MTDDEQLIEEARAFGKSAFRELDKATGMIRRVADALEAATRERDDVSELLAMRGDEALDKLYRARKWAGAAYETFGTRYEMPTENLNALLTILNDDVAPETKHFRCDCVPNLGPAHCHACGDAKGTEVPWEECPENTAAPAPIEAGEREALEQAVTDGMPYTATDRDIISVVDAVLAAGFRRIETKEQ